MNKLYPSDQMAGEDLYRANKFALSRAEPPQENKLSWDWIRKNTFWGRLADSAIGAATLPGDVYNEGVDLYSDDGFRRVTDLAGIPSMGGAVASNALAAAKGADPATIGIFAGINSKMAPRSLPQSAIDEFDDKLFMGYSPEEAYQYTGVFRGADGKPRYEISDKENVGLIAGQGDGPLLLGDALYHPLLYRSYPDLQSIPLNVSVADRLGGAYYAGARERINVAAPDDEDLLRVLLHEVQHAVQEREGFAKGGGSEAFRLASDQRKSLIDGADYLDTLRRELTTPDRVQEFRSFAQTSDNPWVKLAEELSFDPKAFAKEAERLRTIEKLSRDKGFAGYERLAGEVEARNVENRMNMSEYDRAVLSPMSTEDIARKDQILRVPSNILRLGLE